jgi:Lhr-like helicase
MYTFKFKKVEISCNNAYFLLFLAKKSKQKTLRLTKNAVLLLPRSGGAKKNSPHYRAEAVPLQFRLAQTVFGFIRLHSSKTCIFLRPVLPHLGNCTSFQISKYITKNKSVRL